MSQEGENIERASQLEGKVPIVQVEADHYFRSNYDSKERFCSYWHQIQESISLKPEKLLEIGIGNGFSSRYLKERGLNVVTLDEVGQKYYEFAQKFSERIRQMQGGKDG